MHASLRCGILGPAQGPCWSPGAKSRVAVQGACGNISVQNHYLSSFDIMKMFVPMMVGKHNFTIINPFFNFFFLFVNFLSFFAVILDPPPGFWALRPGSTGPLVNLAVAFIIREVHTPVWHAFSYRIRHVFIVNQ